MPACPKEVVAQEPVYEQKGLYCPDGNWLSQRARLNQSGLNTVLSPVHQRKFDGLMRMAIVPRMRMAGESLRGIALITELRSIYMKSLLTFLYAPPSLWSTAAFAWTRIMLASRRISTFGARLVGPRKGVSRDAQCASPPIVLVPSALQRRGII